MRKETRKQRYMKKLPSATFMPIEVACVNFVCDENIAYVIRAAACFGINKVNVIGSLPRDIKALSGSTNETVDIQTFSNPHNFLIYAKNYGLDLYSAEISDEAESIYDANFSLDKACYVFGNETTGIPPEILFKSKQIYIPMPGVGFCLNTSQAANIFMYELSKRYAIR